LFLAVGGASDALGESPSLKPAANDPHGDRLPACAVARFGTTRLRGGGESVAISPDGKLIASGGVWNVATGQELERFRKRIDARVVAFSTDGRTLLSYDGRNLI
jgi:hypothetical protein